MVNEVETEIAVGFNSILNDWEKNRIIDAILSIEGSYVFESLEPIYGDTRLLKEKESNPYLEEFNEVIRNIRNFPDFMKKYKDETNRSKIWNMVNFAFYIGAIGDDEIDKAKKMIDYRYEIINVKKEDDYYNVLNKLKKEARKYVLNYFTSSSPIPPTA